MLQRSHSSELIVGRNIMTMESPFSEIRLHSVGGRVHKRESVGPLMAVNMAGLSGLHSALSVGRGNPRNKTLETLTGVSSAKYQKMHKANKTCKHEDFRDFCHNSNNYKSDNIHSVHFRIPYFESNS